MDKAHSLILLDRDPEIINGVRDLHNNDFAKFCELINSEKIEYTSNNTIIELKYPIQIDINTIHIHKLSFNCISKEIITYNKAQYGDYKISNMDNFSSFREMDTFYEFNEDLIVRLADNTSLESVESGIFIFTGRKTYIFVSADEPSIEKYEHCSFNNNCVVSNLYLIKYLTIDRFGKTKSARKI